MSLFLADDQAVVRNGLKPWSEKFWWHWYLTGAGAQVENLCHQRGRARRSAPPSKMVAQAFQPVQV